MANITLSIEDEVLRRSREYARAHGVSLNALVRQLLERAVTAPPEGSTDELFRLMDDLKADSRGKRWTRDELYDV
jgi:hypothetical protein